MPCDSSMSLILDSCLELCVSVRTIIIPKRHATTNVENHPTKQLKLAKLALLGLIPMDILTNIDTWVLGLKYNDKHKTTTLEIKIPRCFVLLKLTFKSLKFYHNLLIFLF